MHARKRLDIGWSDILSGLGACAFARREAELRRDVGVLVDPPAAPSPPCRRSGLDLLLEMLALPKGSEVLMSALTIPDMWKVVEHNGLVPVPVDVDPETLAPRPGAWRAAVTPRTKLALFAHLFGTRLTLAPLEELRREHGILILEDCAQAYTGADFKGDPAADVSMFSFGPIKTATALAGDVLRIKRSRLCSRRCAPCMHTGPGNHAGATRSASSSTPCSNRSHSRSCTPASSARASCSARHTTPWRIPSALIVLTSTCRGKSGACAPSSA